VAPLAAAFAEAAPERDIVSCSSFADAQSWLCGCSPVVDRHTRKGTQLAPEQSVSVVQGFVVSVPQTCSGSGSNRQTSAPVAASNAMTAPRTQGLSRCDDLPT
jgi:hypothetical protein